jgi:hypothetical protein
VGSGANETSTTGLPPLPLPPSDAPDEEKKCRLCGAMPEPGFTIPLCVECRTRLAQRRIPIGIKIAGVLVGFLLLFSVSRIPASISAAIAFERGRLAESKLQFAKAESEYQKAESAFRGSDLIHARLFIAAFRARDGGTVRREFELLRDRKLDSKLAGEIHALLATRSGH